MTGYGQGEASIGDLYITVQLSSVNRKQLDIRLRLPRELQRFESEIYGKIQKTLNRGHVTGEVFLAYKKGVARPVNVTVNRPLAEACLTQLRDTAKSLDLEDDLRASMLLTLPGIVRFEDAKLDQEQVWPVLSKALTKSLKALQSMRNSEGKTLQDDLAKRTAILEKNLQGIKKRAPQVAVKYRKDLKARIKLAGLSLDDDDTRLLKEVVLFADRSDITEETTRLASHITQMKKTISSAKPAGRKMDFLAQEMLREINTIGSKGNDSIILRDVVVFKTELERLREQVQNIE